MGTAEYLIGCPHFYDFIALPRNCNPVREKVDMSGPCF